MGLPPSATETTRMSLLTAALSTGLSRKISSKSFLALEVDPAQHPLKKGCEVALKLKHAKSTPHSVLGYANDITMPSCHLRHTKPLSVNTTLGLQTYPDKCVSYIFNLTAIKPTTVLPSVSIRVPPETSPPHVCGPK